jgi:hypothetical protein
MDEYEIEEAQLEADGGEVRLDPLESLEVGKMRAGESWQGLILVGLGKLFQCEVWTHGGVLRAYGRGSKANALHYTFAYLCNEVTRLTDEGYLEATRARVNPTKVPAPRWKPGFRLGCAGRLQKRLIERAKTDSPRLGASPGALVVMKKKDAEIRLGFTEFKKETGLKLHRGDGSGDSFDGKSFNAGVAAGNRVSLDGGGKALGAGAARLGPIS